MLNFINSFANIFSEPAPVASAPVEINWNSRLKAAESRIDNAILRDHGKDKPLTVKADIAARLRKQIKEACARHSESVVTSIENAIRSFERYGY